MKIPVRGPGRPRKWKSTDIITLRLPTEIIEIIDRIAAETNRSRTEVIVSLVQAASNVEIAKLLLELQNKDDLVKELQKDNSELHEKIEKLLKKLEQVLLENQALKEENRELKEENRELKRRVRELEAQLRAGFRGREALSLVEDIGVAFSNVSSMKFVDLLRALGESAEGEQLLRRAKAFLERWFRDEGGILVSDELGLVVEKSSKVGILGWRVRRLSPNADSFREFHPKEVMANE
ncbi:ribbon-helix-helix protein, CopG family [Pyrococcus kukulkanii]|uniref:Ribbon-helix-helix protein, CopG family n=1 Tax=Pyrococcus kukulkanii TaxID=1609559 RepID=A0ABV4T6M2_9EURY